MIQNIKVDTIYYLTNSDFEMEFNLCGCCKMRLLTDKAENPKNFVGLLSRAVSRSQVIICCGKLFGNDGLIKIVSQAVKRPLSAVNNSEYGIADDNEINIIEGAVPLVNQDGCFCGCILESGPQSIILLTDNKSIRKTVMKSLIHPYIEELSIIKSAEGNTQTQEVLIGEESMPEQAEADLEQEPLDDNAQAYEALDGKEEMENADIDVPVLCEGDEEQETLQSTDAEDIDGAEECDTPDDQSGVGEDDLASETDSAEDAAEINMPEIVVDETPAQTPEFIDPVEINSGFELYLEPERVKYSKKSHYELNYVPSAQDNEFISQSSDNEFFEPAPKSPLSLPILVIAIVLLVALAALAYLLIFIPLKSDYAFSEYIQNIFSVAVRLKPLI